MDLRTTLIDESSEFDRPVQFLSRTRSGTHRNTAFAETIVS
jgi:hypothetical protein